MCVMLHGVLLNDVLLNYVLLNYVLLNYVLTWLFFSISAFTGKCRNADNIHLLYRLVCIL